MAPFGNKREIKNTSPRSIKRFRAAPALAPATSTTTPVQNSNVKVFIRVRPFNQKETEKGERNVIDVVDSESLIFDPKENDVPFFYHGVKQKIRDPTRRANKNLTFTFNRVFDVNADNSEVFEHTTKGVITSLFEGYNCSVFSYGATGAGKTFTMLGNDQNKGLMYWTMEALNSELDNLRGDHDIKLVVGYIEVYNEVVHDLLSTDSKKAQLGLLEGRNGNVIISGMTTKEVTSDDELFQLLVDGNKNRTQHPTDANAESSRSHAVFQVFVRICKKGTDQVKCFKLSMIDLAGSERAAATQNVKARFKEGSNINKSLLALGNVINALADNHSHIPYRDSKLTRILKDSLGGNCKTIMIANISPAGSSYEDSYNTLKYADRAKKIKSKLQRNVVSVAYNPSQYKKMCDVLQKENSGLKAQLQKLENERPAANSRCTCESMSSPQVKHLKDKLQKLFNEKDGIMKEILNLESQKQILQWRIKTKHFDLQRVSELENGIESSGKGQIKLESSLAQLEGRLVGVTEAISQIEKKLDENSAAIKSVIKEIKRIGLYDILSLYINNLELTLRTNDLEQRYAHGEKLSRLQSVRLDDREQTMTKMSELNEKYFLLLKGFNKVTPDMEQEYKTVWKEIKSVTWDDSDFQMEQSLNSNFALRPIKLFTTDSAQSSPELPAIVIEPPTTSTVNPIPMGLSSTRIDETLTSFSSTRMDETLNGTFVMPKLPSPPKSMKKKPLSSWKQPLPAPNLRSKSPSVKTPQTISKFSQNKENRPLTSARMPPPSARTPRTAGFKPSTAHLPTPGKTGTLATTMKKFGHSKRRNSLTKLLPRDSTKRRSMLKTLAEANQMSTVQFTKTPARFKPKH